MHGLPEDVLRGWAQVAFQLHARGYIPGHKLGKFAIEEGYADFHGAGHAHLVVVGQVQAGHEDLGIQIEHLIEKISIFHFLKPRPVLFRSIITGDFVRQGRGVKRCFLFLIQVRAVHQESFDW